MVASQTRKRTYPPARSVSQPSLTLVRDITYDEQLRDSIITFASTHHHLNEKTYHYQLSKLLSLVERTETGNAIRFNARYGHMFHWISKWNLWYYWNGHVWLEDEKGLIMKYAKQVAAYLELEADLVPLPTNEQKEPLMLPSVAIGASPTPEQQAVIDQFDERDARTAALKKWGIVSRSRRGLEATIELLKDEQGIAVLPDELDKHAYYVCCQNGVLDLHTGELLLHDKDRLITKYINVAYNPLATCPKWIQFLTTAMCGSSDQVTFIQQLLGIGLSAETLEDILAIFYGSGGNGKTVFLEVVKDLMGSYAATANSELLVEKQSEGISNDVARLVNVRLLAASETKEGKHLDEALVKELTGGEKKTARFLRKEFFEFYPCFTPILLTNHMPIIKGIDNGIWRRLRLVPWQYNFEESPERKDKQAVLDELRAEYEGIFTWMIQGYMQRRAIGRIFTPPEVVAATQQYRKDSDLIGMFLDACCVPGPTPMKLFHSVLYDSYKEHCIANGNNPVASNKLSAKFKERGFIGGVSGGKAYWFNIRLKTKEELEAELEDTTPPPDQNIPANSGQDTPEGKARQFILTLPTQEGCTLAVINGKLSMSGLKDRTKEERERIENLVKQYPKKLLLSILTEENAASSTEREVF